MARVDGDMQAKAGNRTHRPSHELQTGDGAKAVFYLSRVPMGLGGLKVYVNGLLKHPTTNAGAAQDYTWDGQSKITFAAAPGAGAKVAFYIDAT